MKRRFLFCIVGVGAGNTTRNLAILRELQTLGECEILIAAQGKARELLEKEFKTVGLREIKYSSTGKFSAASIISSNLAFPLRFYQNMKSLETLMREFQPDLVVADSDFYCLRPARKLGLKLAAINNSALIVEFIRAHGGPPANCRFSYNVIERSDYWLQRKYPHRVLVPAIGLSHPLPPKFVPIPPMVRPSITTLTEPGPDVVVLTSGSGLDATSIDLRSVTECPIRMLGSPLNKIPERSTYVGFTLDVMDHLQRARVLVIQGGFSSLSEAVKLRIPTVIIPIANHAEQWVNGRIVEQLGFGVCASSASAAGEAVNRILADYPRYWAAAQSLNITTDGHEIAARHLWDWAGCDSL